jgi:hypothetical protein
VTDATPSCPHLNIAELHRDGETLSYVCADCGKTGSAPIRNATEAAEILGEERRLRVRTEARRRVAESEHTLPKLALSRSTDDAELLDETVQFLVDEACPFGSIVLVSAEAKTGKTALLQSLALALVKSEPSFLGMGLVPGYKRGVWYLNLDEPAHEFRRGVKLLGGHERFLVDHLPGGAIDFMEPLHVQELVRKCVEHDVGIVIVDVWSSAFGGEENSNTEVVAGWNGVQTLRAQAQLDAVFVAHHAGHARPGAPRGASAFAGKVDVLWPYVQRDGKSYLSVAKGRGVRGVPEFLVHYDFATHKVSRGMSKAEEQREAKALRRNDTDESIHTQILEAVTNEAEPIATAVLRRKVTARAVDVDRVRNAMVAAGDIVELRGPGNVRRYALPSEAASEGQNNDE